MTDAVQVFLATLGMFAPLVAGVVYGVKHGSLHSPPPPAIRKEDT